MCETRANFDKVIKKLTKLGNERPEPDDHLYNITKCVEGVTLNEEEWCNFYRYITTQDKEEFDYLPRSEIHTLGDLGDEELNRIQKNIAFGEGREVECYQNGTETTLIVKNVTTTNKDNGKKPVVGSCSSVPQIAFRRQPKNRPKSSRKNVPQDSDEKQG